jgi:hypothetical protein
MEMRSAFSEESHADSHTDEHHLTWIPCVETNELDYLTRGTMNTDFYFEEIVNFVSCWPGDGGCCIDWVQLSRFYLKTETESYLRNVVL